MSRPLLIGRNWGGGWVWTWARGRAWNAGSSRESSEKSGAFDLSPCFLEIEAVLTLCAGAAEHVKRAVCAGGLASEKRKRKTPETTGPGEGAWGERAGGRQDKALLLAVNAEEKEREESGRAATRAENWIYITPKGRGITYFERRAPTSSETLKGGEGKGK